MATRRVFVVIALALLIALSVPRYLYGLSIGDYSRSAQMVVLVWLGCLASSRYWVKSDAAFARALMAFAAVICIPLLLYHLCLAHHFKHLAGNFVLLAGIGLSTFRVFAAPLAKRRWSGSERPRQDQEL